MSVSVVEHCRSCGADELIQVLKLGKVPVVNQFLSPSQALAESPRYRLSLVRCNNCNLIQTDRAIHRTLIFGEDYPYLSSCSASLLEQSAKLVEQLVKDFALDETSFVVEIASNDGYLLRNFRRLGIDCLGIEPTPIAASHARNQGIATIQTYFGKQVADEIVDTRGKANLVIANNVVAHIAELNDFISGISSLLHESGVFVFEVQYLPALLEHGLFDMIYHEHHSYFTLSTIARVLKRHGLECFDAELFPAQGGSIRVYAAPAGAAMSTSSRFKSLLRRDRELEPGIDAAMQQLQLHVDSVGHELRSLLKKFVDSGARVAAYGAAAKGVVLMNACELANMVEYVADINEHKQGCSFPGTQLPVVSPEYLIEDKPDYVLLLIWNLAREVTDQFQGQDLQFIVPLPKVVVIPAV